MYELDKYGFIYVVKECDDGNVDYDGLVDDKNIDEGFDCYDDGGCCSDSDGYIQFIVGGDVNIGVDYIVNNDDIDV